MGRCAIIDLGYRKDLGYRENQEIKCSGILAQAIHTVIGEERFDEWWLELTRDEIFRIMTKMVKEMSSSIPLSFQLIAARRQGYAKLEMLMLWHYTNDTNDTLVFA